jgi:hypothetical protein
MKRVPILAVALLGAVGMNAAWAAKPPACVYSEEALPPQPVDRSSVRLLGTQPAVGDPVRKATQIGIDVEYHVHEFTPGAYRLIVHFAELVPGSTTIVGDDVAGGRWLANAHGKAHLCAPVAGLFREDDVRFPLEMYVSLQKANGPRSWLLYGETRKVSFPSPDANAQMLERTRLAPSMEFYASLDLAFGFHEENVAGYEACVARFPETREWLDASYQSWTQQHAAVFKQVHDLQMERFTQATRNSNTNADTRLKETRDSYKDFMERQTDIRLRDRCVEFGLVFTGEPRQFIGRYLGVIDEYVANRPPAKPAAKK